MQRVAVEVADRAAADRAGVSGVVVRLSRADQVRRAGRVVLRVDYAGFADAYGGDWASRLRLVTLPDGRPLPTRNDARTRTVSAIVPLRADGQAASFAVTSAPSGDNGDYQATSLSPAATWQVSQQTGDFSWSYPLHTTPGIGGPEPSLGLSYSSGSVDGRSVGTNNQGSWIGDGWDLWPGYIERQYKACNDDKEEMRGGTPNNTGVNSGDQCWLKPEGNATISFNGKATELVKSTGDTWKSVTDDGSKIELLKSTSFNNGDDDGEYWKVTDISGTQYWFGRNSGPGGASGSTPTRSVWTTPVYGNHPDEHGYQSGDFAGSRTTQGWRWNLDYVVDPHGNTMTYFYEKETGAYGREGDASKRTTYDRGGWLAKIEYGNRADASSTTYAAAQVVFDVADRCASNCWSGSDPVEASWLDTPWDQYCKAAPCTDKLSPTYWTSKRLSRIRGQVYSGSGGTYNEVEWWTLRHTYLQSGDNEGKPMWLAGITRTGKVTTAGGTEVSDPEIVFDPGTEPLANRVDGMADGRSNLFRYRIRTITTESGGQISVTYSGTECTRSTLPAVHANTKRCYPQYYAPTGEEPTLDWFHKYRVDRLDVYDNTGGFDHQQTNFDYLDTPAWHYDDSELVEEKKRTWGEYRGYGKVRVRQGLESGVQSAVEYLYLRGMDGDRQPNDTTRDVWVTDSQNVGLEDHEAYAGFLREQTTLLGAGGSWISGTINSPVRQGPTASSGPLRSWMTNTGTTRSRTLLSDNSVRWTKTTATFNSDNLPTEVSDLGDETTADDDLCTRTWYARNDTNWMLDRAKKVEKLGVACDTTPTLPIDMLSATRTTYDLPTNDWDTYLPVKGDAVKVEEIESWNGTTANWLTVGRTVFDANGRIRESYDALDQQTKTDYTPAAGGPVTATKVTNPLGHSNTMTFAPGWHLPAVVVDDDNGFRTDLTYDGLGRLLKVWLPGRAKTSFPTKPSREYTYLVRNNASTAVTTKTLVPWGSSTYATSVVLYDGLLRSRQTQTQAPGGGRFITDTFYDSRGLVARASNPYHDTTNAPVGTTLVSGAGAPAIPSLVENIYDGAGRLTDAILKAGTTEKWRTRTSYSGERTSVTPPNGGTATTTINDARGRTVAVRQYKNPADVGSDVATTFDQVTYSYTDRDELATMVDAAGNTWRYQYDQRGRRFREEDPDKGVTTSTYDALGRMTTSTDARQLTLAYTYDGLGRSTSVREGSVTGPKRAEWVYDTLQYGVGKVTKSIRYEPAGSTNAYVNEVVQYDTAGRPLSSRVTIPAAEGGLCAATTLTPCSYDYAMTYRSTGAIGTTTLPPAAGLPSETLNFTYTEVGLPDGLYSAVDQYIAGVTYDKIGRLTQRVLGGLEQNVTLTDTFEQSTGRLIGASAVPDAKPVVFDLTYKHDDAGNLIKIQDAPAGGSTDTQCFDHDYLRRLTEAWTPSSGDCEAAAPSVAGLGGPAPYWHSYTYDVTGNRRTETLHGVSDTTRTYVYPAQGGAAGSKPHAVSRVDTTGVVTKTENFTYDEVGSTKTRPGGTSGQTLTWDRESHLGSLVDSTGTTSYVYDADGNRLIRRDPGGSTLYLPGGMEVRAPSSGAASCTRYYSHAGSVIAVRSSVDGLSWLADDHHGTAEASIRASDLTVSRRRSLPFGGDRGSPVGTWPASMDKGFVGGTKDNTGLTHLGAREYDATLGRFISVDPLLDLADPQQWQGYSYANNNPTTLSDPGGLSPEDAQWGGLPPSQQSQQNTENRYGSGAGTSGGNGGSGHGSGGHAGGGGVTPQGKPYPARGKLTIEVYAQIIYNTHISNLNSIQLNEARWGTFCYNYPDVCTQIQKDEDEAYKQFFLDVSGITDMKDCINGSLSGCVWTAVGLIPYTAIEKAGAKFGVKLYKALNAACSFGGDTEVLMADGTARKISEIKVGDQVLATDPETGEEGTRVVTQLWVHQDSLLVLSVNGEKITTTEDHPYWNITDQQWQRADALDPGDLLYRPDGIGVPVDRLPLGVSRTAAAYNLTVAGIHTYYVLAGQVPVLVHNSNRCINWASNSVKTWGHTFLKHGAGAKKTRALTDRARKTGDQQGQWLDDGAAAEFLKGIHIDGAGPRSVRIPDGLGQVIMPDGSIVQARAATIVMSPDGLYRTAYPIIGPN